MVDALWGRVVALGSFNGYPASVHRSAELAMIQIRPLSQSPRPSHFCVLGYGYVSGRERHGAVGPGLKLNVLNLRGGKGSAYKIGGWRVPVLFNSSWLLARFAVWGSCGPLPCLGAYALHGGGAALCLTRALGETAISWADARVVVVLSRWVEEVCYLGSCLFNIRA